jgi:hypothetical protein
VETAYELEVEENQEFSAQIARQNGTARAGCRHQAKQSRWAL